ncbi:MAG: hypothetical protein GY773_00895 [Actinomycetia bacterium]|nr:hypothetical protein [Actinomycetes bacterium]
MRTPADVVALYNQRVKDSGVEIQAAREITDLYGGDVWVPLPEISKTERPAVANIARQGIDQKGMRIASVTPEISVWPNAANKGSQSRARDRRRAFYGFHQRAKTKILMRRRARYLVGYGSAPVKIVPSFSTQGGIDGPLWKVRSPIATYADISGEADDMNPADVIFAHRQTLGWVQANYPRAFPELKKSATESLDVPVDLLEYYDAEVIYLLATRRITSTGREWSVESNTPHEASVHATLLAAPNRIERCPVVIPGAITLGHRRTVFHQLIGMYQAAATLDALSRVTIRKGIKRDAWLLAHPGEDPRIEAVPDTNTGRPGIVSGGSLQFDSPDAQFASRVNVDDLERVQRSIAGTPQELGGESDPTKRTARRGAQVLSAVLDFDIQEGHELLEASGELENEIAALTDLHYFRRSTKSISVHFANERGSLRYTPGELWRKNDPDRTPAIDNQVSYAMAGLDAAEGIIALGQRAGMGTMSKETIMRKDPVVDDVEAEKANIDAEALDTAFLTQIQTLAADPNSVLGAGDIARLKTLRKSGLELEEAWVKVQAEIVEREQAAADPNNPATAGTVEAAPEVGGAFPGNPEASGDLQDLLFELRGPTFSTPQG